MTAAPSSRSSNVLWADASALGLSNGATVTNFGGFVTNTGSPTYSLHNLPNNESSVTFNGSQSLSLPLASHATLAALFGNGIDHDFTATVVFSQATISSSYGGLLSNGTGQTRLQLLFNGNGGNPYSENYDGVNTGYPFSTPVKNVPSIITISYTASTHTSLVGYPDGSFVTTVGALPANGVNDLFIGAWGNGTSFAFTGSIAQVVIDNAALTKAQIQSDQAYFANRYNMVGVFCVGDSRTYGTDSSSNPGVVSGVTPYPWPVQAAALLAGGSPNFIFMNFGVAGQESSQISSPTAGEYQTAARCDNPLFKVKQMPCLFGVNSFRYGISPGTGLTAGQSAADIITGLQNWEARASSFPGVYQTIPMSELDEGGGLNNTAVSPASGGAGSYVGWDNWRAAQLAALQAALPTLAGTRRYANLAANPIVGATGASANTTYWGPDELHPTGETSSGAMGGGYGVMASIIAPVLQQLYSDLTAAPFASFGFADVGGGTGNYSFVS